MSNFNWPVIGHEKIINYLQTVIANDSPHHAYLFYGPDGLGKSLVADLFLQSLLCQNSEQKPCGTCSPCRQVSKGIYPDVYYLMTAEGKKNITIEQVRGLKSQIQCSTFLHGRKIILVKEANKLSLSAANALLKILEEPVGRTVFIFLSPNLANIPATIISRLEAIKFLPLSLSLLEKYLSSQGISRLEARELAHLSQGFPGRILPFVKHPKLLSAHKQERQQIIADIWGDINTRFALAEKLAGQNNQTSKVNSRQFLTDLIFLLRDILLVKNMCFNAVTHTWLNDYLSTLSHKYSSATLSSLIKQAEKSLRDLEMNVNVRLSLENLFLQF